MSNSSIKYLDWDSGFFGKKIGRIRFEKPDHLKNLLQIAKSSDYQLIYVFINEDSFIEDLILKQFNGKLVDRKVLFGKEIHTLKEEYKFVSKYKSKQLTPELEQLAYESGQYSRFKLDSNFEQDDFYKMYKIWILKSLTNEMADNLFVVKENNVLKGMVTLKIDNEKGHIGLIAVSPDTQSKGYGKALINACENELLNKGITKLEVSTQIDNIPACKFYKKCGFEIKEITNIYHFWL